VPGDGKFDPSKIPSPLEFEVGRIDLYKMDAFSTNDTLLVKQYLDRNHLWRIGKLKSIRRALIDNNFSGLNLASTGYHNLSAMIPYDSIFDNRDYKTSLKSAPYLWAYGCGAGSYTSCNGIGNTADFAADSFQNIFTMLAGSYFGDWDIKNNLLRAPLANSALTCFWGGIPKWYVHHMAMGMHIGYGALLSMNNNQLYFNGNFNFSHQGVHMALMGDPTLKLHYVSPVENLTASSTSGKIELNWTASSTPGSSYFVYRVDSVSNTYTKLHTGTHTQTSFTDAQNFTSGKAHYVVCAAELDQTAGGTYWATSPGTFVSVNHTASAPALIEESDFLSAVKVFPNPGKDQVYVEIFSTGETTAELKFCDLAGRSYAPKHLEIKTGTQKLALNTQNLKAGMYLIEISSGQKTQKIKWVKYH
jgi:hypothetical protein